MSGTATRRRQGAPAWVTALTIAGVVVAIVAVLAGVLWLTVLPPALTNLTSSAVPTDRTVAVGEATVTVPARWVAQHPPFTSDELRLISPDGGVAVTVTDAGDDPDAAFAQGTDAAIPVRETLASGAAVLHGQPSADTMVAVVSRAGRPAVRLVAHASAGEITPYTRAIADLLEGVEP